MKRLTKGSWGLIVSASIFLTACGDDSSSSSTSASEAVTASYKISKYGKPQLCPEGVDWASKPKVDEIREQVGLLDDNETLEIPEGCYKFENEITLVGRSNITIKGAGINKTFLDFSNSSAGEGISVSGSTNVVISDLQVSEAAKNAIKVTKTNGLIIRNVAAIWMTVPRSPDPKTGALRGTYALYPVSSSNILIENTWSYGSADAGVYVGQSKNVVVRNNVAERNIAGIEIENTENADVYNNLSIGNTGGLLVFDLPGAAVGTDGDPSSGNITKNVRLFNNIVRDNNLNNYVREACRPNCGFAGGVHIVPPGTGVIVLSARDTEIFNNTISNHDSVAVAIASYLIAEPNMDKYAPPPTPGGGQEGTAITFGWNPVPTKINVHDNLIENTSANPNGDLIKTMITGYKAKHNSFPNVLYDGIGEVVIRTGQHAAQANLSVGFKPIADALEAKVAGTPLVGFWRYLWNMDDNNVCINNNALDVTVGSLYAGTDIAGFSADSEFFIKNPNFGYGLEGELLDCTLASQVGGSAVINNKRYSYAGDTDVANSL